MTEDLLNEHLVQFESFLKRYMIKYKEKYDSAEGRKTAGSFAKMP